MDMSYLKDMPIAVLGGGAVGKTMAADCALAGKEVRIWDQPRFAKTNFLNIEKTGITAQLCSSAHSLQDTLKTFRKRWKISFIRRIGFP